MSMPLDNDPLHGPVDDRLIDRLVDGELPQRERRELLLRLDAEPGGWRQCALAFLEAQSWRETFNPLARGMARPVVVQAAPERKPRSWRPVARWTALAASVAAAFALGWAWHGGTGENPPSAPVVEVVKPDVTMPPPLPAEHTVADAQPAKSAEAPVLPDAVVKQWEQQGYQAEHEDRRVSVELKDGRKLDVPIHEVRVRYIGGRTY